MSQQIKYGIARLVREALPGVTRELNAQYSGAERVMIQPDNKADLSTVITVHEADGVHGYRVTVSELT